ncbi:hypothetical protein Tco_0770928 [Tanacetum coccineum]|uniref:Uncharacterized protein n=1 Tax=Tanacetum coccineum TaxID=301880 RepID=A0ABQ4ZEL9_9ASTR
MRPPQNIPNAYIRPWPFAYFDILQTQLTLSLGDELRPLRDELRLHGADVRLYGTKDKPHRSEARARRLDHDNGVETRVYGQRLRDEETIVMVFGRSMYSRTMI